MATVETEKPLKLVDVSLLLDAEQVAQKLSISLGTLETMIRTGRFPRPLRIGKRIRRWTHQQIADWVAKMEDQARQEDRLERRRRRARP